MFVKSIMLSLIVFGLGAVISIFVASLIRGIFVGIRFRENVQAKSSWN
jgi:hypothetical protein